MVPPSRKSAINLREVALIAAFAVYMLSVTRYALGFYVLALRKLWNPHLMARGKTAYKKVDGTGRSGRMNITIPRETSADCGNDGAGHEIFNKRFIADNYPGMVCLRPIYENDIPLLADFLYLAIFLPPGAEPLSREIIFKPDIHIYIKDYGQKDDCGVIAEISGKAVGAAWVRIIPAYGHTDNGTPELAISVLPEYRGQGIGTQLLTRLFDLLRKRGVKRTSLSVQKANPAARLYQRMGYEIFRENDEDYIMVKTLCQKIDTDKLHTTEMGVERIKGNLGLNCGDVAAWCKQAVLDAGEGNITRKGKNWYIDCGGFTLTINAHSHTIITAHKKEAPEGK
jgi:ribosomal protein S18 acetylase RimI-like enzyme